jgi:hypothetical protein
MRHIKLFVDAMEMWQRRHKSYGDYGVTTLLKPPRMVQLERRYGDRVIRPLEGLVSAFMGHGVHSAFEENLRLKSILEPRYDVERTVVDKIEDRLISGRYDILWDNKDLYDIKTTKVWKVVFDPHFEEWHQQLNLYAYLLKRRGLEIASINIIAVFMDWSAQRAMRERLAGNGGYPPDPVMEYTLELWPYEKSEHFIIERINAMKDAENLDDASLPLCTSEERWMRTETGGEAAYALMLKPDARRATKICQTLDEAVATAKITKGIVAGQSYIEVRYPVAKRCESFCAINEYCNQYEKYMASKVHNNLMERIPL